MSRSEKIEDIASSRKDEPGSGRHRKKREV